MDVAQIQSLHLCLRRALGDWWCDDRRYWCAYCGIPMKRRVAKGVPIPPTKSTRDHVIPRSHKGGLLTIPACRSCNAAKGALSLPEFLESEHFRGRRQSVHRHRWTTETLWVVTALAALRVAEKEATGREASQPLSVKADHTR